MRLFCGTILHYIINCNILFIYILQLGTPLSENQGKGTKDSILPTVEDNFEFFQLLTHNAILAQSNV